MTSISHESEDGREAMTMIGRLSRDLSEAAVNLSVQEVRFLVDLYYQMQEQRIRTNLQMSAAAKVREPNKFFVWVASQNETLENRVKRALDIYSSRNPMGEWMRSIVGIGPVISAGLLAHI